MPIKPTPSMTAELADKAVTLVTIFGLKQHQAAAILGLNQGRISEVMTGKSYPSAKPFPPDQLSFDL
jgi:predicted XRE-type DNA-binding protein